MPDRPDDDELLSLLVSEAGDPQVELRPEHIAELRALLLDRLGPSRVNRPWRMPLLIGAALAASCLVAVFAWPRGNDKVPGANGSAGQTSPQISPRPPQSPARAIAWRDVRRELDVSEMPAFSWPLQESPRLTVAAAIPPDLLD